MLFYNVLSIVPPDDWNRTWAADRTIMLRMTSKRAKEAIENMKILDTDVKINRKWWHTISTNADKKQQIII